MTSQALNLEQLIVALPDIEAEALRWRNIEADAAAKAIDLETIIRAVRRLTPSVAGDRESDASSPPHPEGMAAVIEVMTEQPDRLWRAKDLTEILRQRGWLSTTAKYPERGVDTAIARLLGRGDIERVERGRYRVTGRPSQPNRGPFFTFPRIEPDVDLR